MGSIQAAVIFGLVLLARPGCPQTPGTAAVTGRVTDPQGKVVAGASVSLSCQPKGSPIPGATNGEGQYLFSPVLPGMYVIEVEATGFSKVVARHVRLAPAATVVQDFQLVIGALTNIVEVIAPAEPLETGNAAIETQVSGRMLQRLPSGSRQIGDLLGAQPGSHSYGFVHGAQSDQNSIFLDGVEVTDVTAGFGSLAPIAPVPIESVDEFRAILANPPPQAALGTGAQFAIETKSGRGEFHGSIYGYDQNSALNANLWPFNRLGIPRPDNRQNRFGVSGGRSFSDGRTALFAMYEGNRRDQHSLNGLAVPSNSLRHGLLRFRDAAGNIHTIDPKTYDPRGLGADPLVLRALQAFPTPNSAPNWPADGLNTGTYNFLVPMQGGSNFGLVRLERDLTTDGRWRLDGSTRLFLDRGDTWGKTDAFTRRSAEIGYTNQRQVAAGLTTILSSATANRLQLAWTQSRVGTRPIGASPTEPFGIAANLAGYLLGQPVSVLGVPNIETVINSDELSDQFVHQTGRHRFQLHASVRQIPIFDWRNGTGWGSQATSTPVASIGAGQLVGVPAVQRPSFLQPWEIGSYNTLYSTLLGIVDQVSVLRVRDGTLNPLPFGTNLLTRASFRIWEFSFNDTWRLTPGVTVTMGMGYGWQSPPVEAGLRQMMPVYVGTGQIVQPMDYLRQKRAAAEAGSTFAPAIGFEPLAYLHRDSIFHADRRNISPRASAAWNPSFGNGWLRAIFGDRRSVIRGGYSLLYDRTNTPTTLSIPAFGVGFGETDFLTPTAAGSQPFRVGIDGNQIPLPVISPGKAPIIPSSLLFASALDPNLRTPYCHVVTVAIQRQMSAKMLLEVSYVGRMARKLYEAVNLNSVPYMFRDVASGQTLAQAFDAGDPVAQRR